MPVFPVTVSLILVYLKPVLLVTVCLKTVFPVIVLLVTVLFVTAMPAFLVFPVTDSQTPPQSTTPLM